MSRAMSRAMRWRRRPDVLWRRTPSHVVALRPEAAEADILSGAGRDLWDLLAEPLATEAIAQALGAASADLLSELEVGGLIERGDEPAHTADGEHQSSVPAEAPSAAWSADPLVGALTFWLPGGADPILLEPLGDAGWQDLLARARRERCLGPLSWAVGTGLLASTDAQRDEAERYAILGARRAVGQDRELLALLGWFDEAGVDARVLKGVAVAHLDHVDPSFRASADHDLLVPGADVEAAVDLLVQQGFRRELPERRAGFDRRFAKDVTLQRRDHAEVDLHRLPIAGPLGLALDVDALWAGRASFRLGGREVPALDATARFCHAAWSLALTDPAPRLVPALDMVAIDLAHGIDADRLEALAPVGAGRGAIDRAIALAAELLGPAARTLLPTAGPPMSRAEARAIAAYPGQGGSKAAYLLRGTGSLAGWRDRAQYVHGLVAPTRAYRRARRQHHRRPEWRLALRAAGRRFRGTGS